jgi:5'-nucleotidase/UDP-sugar diphosphatase
VQPQWKMIANAGIAPDPQTAALVKTYADRLDAELGQVIGRTEVELDTRAATVRRTEARFGNLVADAMRELLGADVAITNGGGIRGNRIIAAGTAITRKDIIRELPFGNLAYLVELKGEDLKAALENGVSAAEQGAGRFPQVSGMTVEYDVARPPGERVTKLNVGGKPCDPAARYRVAVSDYMANGGDGYAALTRGMPLADSRSAPLLATLVIDWIAARKTVAPQLEGRILAKP